MSAAPLSARRRSARVHSGQALFGAFASTIRLLRWLLVGLFSLYLGSGITRVAPNEDALIYRLGTLQREIHPPGLLFALPPPIDRIVRVPTRTQHESFLIDWSPDEDAVNETIATLDSATRGEEAPAPVAGPAMSATMPGEMAATTKPPMPTDKGLHPVRDGYSVTGDANLVQARFTSRYRIVDPVSYVSAVQPDAAKAIIDAAIYDSATRILATMKIDDALGSGLESFRSRVLTASQQRLDTLRGGIELVAFEVNFINPPQAAAAAFADVTSAQVESRTTLEKSRTYRAQILPNAKGEAFRIRSQADAGARQLAAQAMAEAASFTALSERQRTEPALIEIRLHAETIEAVLQQVKTTTVLPDDGGMIDLYLPTNP